MISAEAKRYDQGMAILERMGLQRQRRQLLRHARGHVLEIGVGTGVNFGLYGDDVVVSAVDIDPQRLSGAIAKADHAPASISLSRANAHYLPFVSNSFDTLVSTLVFCSIPNVPQALAELRRVLRPGGQLLMLEHVRGQNAVSQRLTDWMQPAWFALQGECHLNRETAEAVTTAGFQIDAISTHAGGIVQMIRASVK